MKSRETSLLARAPLHDARLALTNSDISELLATEADSASQPNPEFHETSGTDELGGKHSKHVSLSEGVLEI